MTYHRDRTEGAGAISAFLPAHRSAPAPRIRARRPGRWHLHGALGLVKIDDDRSSTDGRPPGSPGYPSPVRRISASAPMLQPLMTYGTSSSGSGISTSPTGPGILTAPPAVGIRYPLQIGSGIGQPVPVVVPLPPKPVRGGVRAVAPEAVMPGGHDLELVESPAQPGGSASPAISINRMPLLIVAAGLGLAWYLFRGKGRH